MAKGNNAHKLMAAGTATLIAEPALAFAHQGGLGVIVGLVAGAVAYGIVDDLEQRTGRQIALPGSRARHSEHKRAAREGQPNPLSRLLVGKSVREAEAAAAATDEQEEDETVFLHEDEGDSAETLELGDLRPHADTVLSNRIAILGMSGAGKSNVLGATVEELGQFDAPLILFDLKPEYWPLCQQPYLINPARMHAQNLTPQNAATVAQRIMDERLQVVVDLSSYASDAQAALIMTELVAGVLRYQKARDNAERIPCTFIVEEAHYWLPENEAHSTIRGVKLRSGQSLLGYMQQAFFTLAKVGRSFGMGVIVATQRPADIDKRLISQAEWRFLLKAMEPADLKVYRSYGLADEVAQTLNPKKGEAYVIGPDGSRGVYHIRRRYSPDVAQSPGLSNIRNAGARSVRSPFPQAGRFERGNTPAGTFPGNTGTSEKRPVERVGTVPGGWERSPALGNTGNAAPREMEEAEGYTHEEETQVLLAYADLHKNGEQPTRRAIRSYLEWSNRDFSRVIKPVCDKHNIAVRE